VCAQMVHVCVCVCAACVCGVWGAWNWGAWNWAHRGTFGHAPDRYADVDRARAIPLDVV